MGFLLFMRMFFTDLINYATDGANNTGSTIKTFLKRRINSRYELVTDKLNTWTQVCPRTASTVDGQQFYYNPPNLREIESIVVTIGDFDYPLKPVYAQGEWDVLNAQTITSAFPERFFRRANDYGIWPTPGTDDGTITINYTKRAIPLTFENYVTGTAAVTENDQTVTLTTGVTSTLKAGFWYCLSDSSGEPRGSVYRIGSISAGTAAFELETFWEEATEATPKYIVGQSPEIPEEGHELLAIGAVADFYGLKTKDMNTYTKFNNMFWSGSPNITALQARKDEGEAGGLVGLIAAYEDRDSDVVVERVPTHRDLLEFRIPRTISVA